MQQASPYFEAGGEANLPTPAPPLEAAPLEDVEAASVPIEAAPLAVKTTPVVEAPLEATAVEAISDSECAGDEVVAVMEENNGETAVEPFRRAGSEGQSSGAAHRCAECGRAFDSLHGLKVHRGRHCSRTAKLPPPPPPVPNARGLYECGDCGSAFDKPHGLAIHRGRHCAKEARPPKPAKPAPPPPNAAGLFECVDCGSAFERLHGLTIHRARHCSAVRGEAREGGAERKVRRRSALVLRDSIQPPPAPPPACRCGVPAVWERQRYWCAAADGSGCGYEARVPPPPHAQSPLCDCRQLAAWDRRFWWCAVSGGGAGGGAAGCSFMVRARLPQEQPPAGLPSSVAQATVQGEGGGQGGGGAGHPPPLADEGPPPPAAGGPPPLADEGPPPPAAGGPPPPAEPDQHGARSTAGESGAAERVDSPSASGGGTSGEPQAPLALPEELIEDVD